MTKTTKMTKRMVLEAIKDFMAVKDGTAEIGVVDDLSITAADVIAYVNTTLAQMEAKSTTAAKRAAEKRAKGDELQSRILEMLGTEPITADEIVKAIDDEEVTKSKVVSRMSNLIKSGQAAKVQTKVGDAKRMAYTLPIEESSEIE